MIIRGKNIAVTEAIDSSIRKKLKKVTSMTESDDFCVLVCAYPGEQACAVTAETKFGGLYATAVDENLYNAIDEVADRLMRQYIALKEKKVSHRRKAEPPLSDEEETHLPERHISHKPITEEEAILLLEAENHEFQPFVSLDGDVRVVYRLKKGGYGVLRI